MRLFWITALVVLGLDQGSKYVVVHWLRLDEVRAINVFPPYLNFRMAWNDGVNFGLLGDLGGYMRWVLIALALAISAWLVAVVMRGRQRPVVRFAAGLLVGGALGNVIDRLLYGAVADFLNMSCCGLRNPYAFNVADIAVFAGAFGLIVFMGREKTP